MDFDYNAAADEFIEDGYTKCQSDIDVIKGFVSFLTETKLAAVFAVDGYIDNLEDGPEDIADNTIEVLEEFVDFVNSMGG